ncbi:MAG TPA: ABC transporter ATP-binding protein [Mycobacteriales bacterium]
MTRPAVVVDGVSKSFRLYHERNGSLKAALMRGGRARYEEFPALSDVSLQIPQGSTFGLMGVNGSGKSTLLKCIANILRPDSGTILTAGKLAALLELGSGFHPELSGRENIFLNGSILGLSRSDLDARFDDIVGFAGVETFIDQPVKNYSSGMYVRLGFSIAINVDPDVLLVDEVLAVGDQEFQDKCAAKFAEFKRNGKTVILVSHALGSMRQMCDEVAWLDAGKVVDVGPPDLVIDRYIDVGHHAEEGKDGSRRWGTGEVTVTDVAVLDAHGNPTTSVHTSDEASIRVRYDAHQPVADPLFGLTIQTREGTVIWMQDTGHAKLDIPLVDGRGEVLFHVPNMMLLPNHYDLNVSVQDRSRTETYDFIRNAYPFRITPGPERHGGGFVRLAGQWSLSDANAEIPAIG